MIINDFFSDPEVYLEIELEEAALTLLHFLKVRVSEHPNKMIHRRDISVEIAMLFRQSTSTRQPIPRENEFMQKIAGAFDYLKFNCLLSAKVEQENSYVITEKGWATEGDSDLETSRLLKMFVDKQLHQRVIDSSYDSFLRQDYDNAVFKAFRALEDRVRMEAGLTKETIGRGVMNTAFKDGGTLRDPTEHKTEADSFMNICSGAVGYLKNPSSHRAVNFDPIEVIEILFMASWMHRQVDTRIESKSL